jgi:hypothetical protein
MSEIESSSDDFANAFESAFARLQVAVEEACARGVDWPAKLAGAVEAALDFAAADPAAARALTLDALIHRPDGGRRYLRLIEHFANLLRAQAPRDRRRPPSTEQALVGGLATLIADHLRAGRTGQLRETAPDLVEFVLRAYGG